MKRSSGRFNSARHSPSVEMCRGDRNCQNRPTLFKMSGNCAMVLIPYTASGLISLSFLFEDRAPCSLASDEKDRHSTSSLVFRRSHHDIATDPHGVDVD